MTNTRYEEDPAGDQYVRFRYSPGAEAERRSDTVRLSSAATTLTAGNEYLSARRRATRQLATTRDGDGDSVRHGWRHPS